MKDAFYFPHDTNAACDPKLAALINIHGMAGYGQWWQLIELLHGQGGRFEKFPKLFTGLAQAMKQNEAVLEAFFRCLIDDLHLLKEDDKYIWSDRVIRNFQEREDKRLKKVDAGRKGGFASGEIRSKTKQNEALLEANEPKERKGKERIRTLRERFAAFWACYPRRVAKGAAEKAFEKVGSDDELFETILKAVNLNREINPQWKKDDGKFIPHPASWLNQRRWEDDLEASTAKTEEFVI